MLIQYSVEPDLSTTEFIDLLHRSTLAERRPVSNLETMEAMLRNADIILTARAETEEGAQRLVGVARALTDFAYCTYLSDLAVDQAYQKQGIGRELIHQTHQQAGLATTLILLSAPKAVTYYPHIGMTPHPSCWFMPAQP